MKFKFLLIMTLSASLFSCSSTFKADVNLNRFIGSNPTNIYKFIDTNNLPFIPIDGETSIFNYNNYNYVLVDRMNWNTKKRYVAQLRAYPETTASLNKFQKLLINSSINEVVSSLGLPAKCADIPVLYYTVAQFDLILSFDYFPDSYVLKVSEKKIYDNHHRIYIE